MPIEAARQESGSPAERRRESRIAAQVDLSLAPADDARDTLQTDSVNLSLGGVCVRTERSYPVGKLLGLNIVLGDEALDLRRVVVGSRPQAVELGVCFVDLSEAAGARIEAVVLLLAAATS